MCVFLSLGSPAPIAEAFRGGTELLNVVPFTNDGSGHRYANGMHTYLLVDAMCSCQFVSFMAAKADRNGIVKKARKGRWSPSKLERALCDAERAAQRRARGRTAVHEDVLALLESHLSCVPFVELIAHWHGNGVVTEERFDLVGTRSVSLSELRALPVFEADVRFRVTAREATAAAYGDRR